MIAARSLLAMLCVSRASHLGDAPVTLAARCGHGCDIGRCAGARVAADERAARTRSLPNLLERLREAKVLGGVVDVGNGVATRLVQIRKVIGGLEAQVFALVDGRAREQLMPRPYPVDPNSHRMRRRHGSERSSAADAGLAGAALAGAARRVPQRTW